jgi:hypothetical protein
MLSGPESVNIRLQATGGVDLRTGELVSVQVLNRLAGGKWAVGIQGRVLPASSALPLTAGSRLLVRVASEGGRLVLKVLERPLPALRELAVREGLPPDKATEQILAAFLAGGLKVQSSAVRQVRLLLDRLRLPPQRFARLAVQLLEKNIDLASPCVDTLLPLLGFGEDSGRRRKGRGRREPDPFRAEAALKGRLRDSADGEQGPLALFNHLRCVSEQWVIVPFQYGELAGTIRLLRASPGAAARRLVLTANTPEGGRWSFVLTRGEEGQGYALCSFRDRDGKPAVARRRWLDLAQKLQNLGVKSDDTIRVDDDFDGFSLPWETVPYRGVDTTG